MVSQATKHTIIEFADTRTHVKVTRKHQFLLEPSTAAAHEQRPIRNRTRTTACFKRDRDAAAVRIADNWFRSLNLHAFMLGDGWQGQRAMRCPIQCVHPRILAPVLPPFRSNQVPGLHDTNRYRHKLDFGHLWHSSEGYRTWPTAIERAACCQCHSTMRLSRCGDSGLTPKRMQAAKAS